MPTTFDLLICVSEHKRFIIFNVIFLNLCDLTCVLPFIHEMLCSVGFVELLLSFLFGLLSSTFEIFFISIITVRVLSMLVLIAAIFCLISTLRLAFSSCYFCYLVFFSIENTIPFSLVSLWGVILHLVVKLSGSLWSYFLFYFVNHL